MKSKFVFTIFSLCLISISLSRCFEALPKKAYKLQNGVSTNSLSVKTFSQTRDYSQALQLIDARLEVVRGVFSPEVDPYVGKKIIAERCRPENLPKMIEMENPKQIAKAISLYSSENRIFGNCTTDNLLKTQYLVLFCKKTGELFGFTYYYADQQSWAQQPIAFCD